MRTLLTPQFSVLIACLILVGCGPTSSEKAGQTPKTGYQNGSSVVFPHQLNTNPPVTFERDSSQPLAELPLSDDPDLNENAKKMKKGAEITAEALKAVVATMVAGQYERDVKKVILDTFKAKGAQGEAFPAIVGSGPNSCDIHYPGDSRQLKAGDMVVIDIGAKYANYCSDLSRTYPVGAKFSQRQKEVYQLVLDAKNACAASIKPGTTTLNELTQWTKNYFRKSKLRAKDPNGTERTMDYFFTHGLGHFVDTNVHGSGNMSAPIPNGRVFTIEPGLYIKSENLGIRIEDDYYMTAKGAVKLLEGVPDKVEDIEALMKK